MQEAPLELALRLLIWATEKNMLFFATPCRVWTSCHDYRQRSCFLYIVVGLTNIVYGRVMTVLFFTL